MIDIFKELDAYEFKVYSYFVSKANAEGIVWNIKHADIEKDCVLGYSVVYRVIKSLKTKELIEFNGFLKKAVITELQKMSATEMESESK